MKTGLGVVWGLTSTSQMPALKVIIGVMDAILCVFVRWSNKDQVCKMGRNDLASIPKMGGGLFGFG